VEKEEAETLCRVVKMIVVGSLVEVVTVAMEAIAVV
jgi:hypothetical protein